MVNNFIDRIGFIKIKPKGRKYLGNMNKNVPNYQNTEKSDIFIVIGQ